MTTPGHHTLWSHLRACWDAVYFLALYVIIEYLSCSHFFTVCTANILKKVDEEIGKCLLQVLTLISVDSYHEEMSLGP